MAHTPGPWAVRWPADGELHEIYAEDGGDLICYPVFTANQSANIPLLAAAPDLLDALRSVKNELIELYERAYPDDESDNDTTRAIDAAIAAIAKAEGRTDDQG